MKASSVKVSALLSMVLWVMLPVACTGTPPAVAATSMLCTGSKGACKNQALQLQAAYDTSRSQDIELWPHSDVIIADAAMRAQKAAITGPVGKDGKDTYRTKLGERAYYLTVNSYIPLTQADRAAMTDTSTKIYPGFCVFYLYDTERAFVSSYVAKVGNGHVGTNCNSIYGVSGVAFHGKPALLAIVQFVYTNGKAASSAAQIGTNYIQTAVLMPLVQQPDGTWRFTQDTTCFASTNTIDSLAKAKAHLNTCH